MAGPAQAQLRVAWAPQSGPQAALVKCPFDEIFFGGARGGGKTDGMLGKHAIKAARFGEDCVGVFFRRTREDLKEAIERSHQIYRPIGAEWSEQKKQWRFPGGGRLKFEYLAADRDAQNYQGHNYTDLYFEELTNWPDPAPIDKLRATLRSAKGVPCQFHATGNPGGPGHTWVKARYIDPNPAGWDPIYEEFTDPFTKRTTKKSRIFIPSKLTDNKYLGIDYVATLQQSGSKELVRAWLEGDWDVVDGAFFDCWSASRHVLVPFAIPEDWTVFRSMDWGSAAPFSVGWWAIVAEDHHCESVTGAAVVLPRGAMVRFQEWYGASAPNKGLKLTAEEVAAGVSERDATYRVGPSVADPAMWAEDGGPSLAERFLKAGVFLKRADNRRVASRGAMGGWDQMRARLVGVDGNPMIACFSTCKDSIRTIPALPHDERRLEDIDTAAEDHAADEWRYACMSRPWTPPPRVGAPNRKPDDYRPTRMGGGDAWTL